LYNNVIRFFIILFFLSSFYFAQDAREKSHSMNILPFIEDNVQKYYVTWSSSSGSDDGWQHDIYNQIVSFDSTGEMIFNTNPKRYIGNGNDEAQEPVNVAINPIDNTMLTVWEDGSGSTVDVRGQLHKPDGTIIKSNWIIAGGEESQHSPVVVHLKNKFLVALTDEAYPAQSSMNVLKVLNDITGTEVSNMELSPRDKDQWWTIAASNNKNIAFVGWGNGEEFYGRILKGYSDTLNSTEQKFYFSSIDQYYYSVAWLEEISHFIAIAKINNNSAVCLIDTNGIRKNFTIINNAPITRETKLAVDWDSINNVYEVCYTSRGKDLTILSVTDSEIKLKQINKMFLTDGDWPTTGIACQFVKSTDKKDLWKSKRKILIAYNDNNSNDAIYLYKEVEDLTFVTKNMNQLIPNKIILFDVYPNPFNPSTTIQYAIPFVKTLHSSPQYVQLKVYNMLGREVATLVNKQQTEGKYKIQFNADNLPSGTYYYQLKVGSFLATKKMLLIK